MGTEKEEYAMSHKDLTELSSELTYHRYIFNQGQMAGLFGDISVPEYIALYRISHAIAQSEDGRQRTYLKEIAEALNLSVPKTSQVVSALRDKGLISWRHDGNGRDGTYVTMTASGERLMEKQEAALKNYYGQIIEKFGEDKLITLFELMKELENVMGLELNEKGEVEVKDGNVRDSSTEIG
jgi:DNA-binding MarR family transcriptional regulator